MPDPQTWRAHITADLDRLQAGLLDLIDCGLPQDDTDVRLRRPTDDEVKRTRRGDDTDADYATPAGPSGRSQHISDPTGAETIRWTHVVAEAIADVDQLLADWTPDTDRVARQGGTTVPPPPAPVDLTVDDDGHVRATIHPARARRAAIARIRWLTTAADAILDHWEHETDADLIAFWDDRTHVLRHQLHRTTLHHGRRDRHDVRCANPHGLHNHPAGPDAIDGVCKRCRTAPTCDDRYGYGCTKAMIDEGPRTTTCNSCQQRAYRERKELVQRLTG